MKKILMVGMLGLMASAGAQAQWTVSEGTATKIDKENHESVSPWFSSVGDFILIEANRSLTSGAVSCTMFQNLGLDDQTLNIGMTTFMTVPNKTIAALLYTDTKPATIASSNNMACFMGRKDADLESVVLKIPNGAGININPNVNVVFSTTSSLDVASKISVK